MCCRKRLFSHCRPLLARLFGLIALELVRDPEHCTKDHGTIVAGQADESGFHDETAEFDEVPRSLAALDLP